MKKNDIYEEIGNISPDLIAEADPTAPIVTRKTKIRRILSAVAACFALVIISSCLWLFVPYSRELPEALELIRDHEFYDLYLKTYEYYESRNSVPKNNYEKYVEPKVLQFLYDIHRDEMKRGDEFMSDGDDNGIASSGNSAAEGSEQRYVEVTDNQVIGIIEPDLFKRTDTHLFYIALDEDSLYSYSIDGEDSALCGMLEDFGAERGANRYRYSEMFLSADGNRLYVIESSTKLGTLVFEIDVSDPSDMKRMRSINLPGTYLSSRMVGGKMLVGYYDDIDIDITVDFTILTDPLPDDITVTDATGASVGVAFTSDEIVLPEKMVIDCYQILLQIDLETMTVEDKLAMLSLPLGEPTVFEDKIVIGGSYEETEKVVINTYPSSATREYTVLAVISYGEGGLEYLGQTTFDGTVVNRYALDVDGSVLRVVTTSESRVWNRITLVRTREDLSCNIWCYDITKNKMIASVKNFAPEDEEVKSVRFDGDMLYICTAKVVVVEDGSSMAFDPVYFFDLSDYKKIKSIDTGEIEGYSTSLKPFGEGILLGIGYGGDAAGLKIEIYADKGNHVESLAAYEKSKVHFATQYHSYLIDSKGGYIGFAFTDLSRVDDKAGYILLHFDGNEIVGIAEEYFYNNSWNHNQSRSVIIDGYLYIMYESDLRVVKIK